MSKDFTHALKHDHFKGVDWLDWKSQLKSSLKTVREFNEVLSLSDEELEAFKAGSKIFNIQTTPYYASLIDPNEPQDPIRKMIMPDVQETVGLELTQNDPLGEVKNSPCKRIVHRYADRVLFLITDYCGIYCRYCTRKHFTGGGSVLPSKSEYETALSYIRQNKNIREVILSGGDPLTLSNEKLHKIISDLDEIKHVDLIRVGSRMPAACPMRLDKGLMKVFKKKTPVVLMSHFNHHLELPKLTKEYLRAFAESGVQIFNQMVILNGINNDASLVYKLSRELISCKVFPYYMFQCDPSPGTGHLQTSIEESLKIQKELWGHASGVALPTYSVDIPSGGGKTYLTPDFIKERNKKSVTFKGFDGVEAVYVNPIEDKYLKPLVSKKVSSEWDEIKKSKEGY